MSSTSHDPVAEIRHPHGSRLVQSTDGPDTARILAALQIHPRASWPQIAEALGMHERTVARRAQDMIDRGLVRVAAVSAGAPGTIIEVETERGAVRMAAKALANRPDVSWLHLTTGRSDLLGEVTVPDVGLAEVVIDELQAIPGARRVRTNPSLDYLRVAKDWDPGVLTQAESVSIAEQNEFVTPAYEVRPDAPALDPVDEKLCAELTRSGRATFVDLSRTTGVSESTVRRRMAKLVAGGHIAIRAVFAPRRVGLPMTVVMRLSVPPRHLTQVSRLVAAESRIRNAMLTTGQFDILIQLDVASRADLRDVLGKHPMMKHIDHVETAVVLRSAKRSRIQFEV